MAFESVSRNQPCPCGSGKKYKKCCYHKDFKYVEDEQGTIHRQIRVDDNTAAMLFDELGIDPKSADPERLLFEGVNLEHVEHEISAALDKAGIDPAIVYAFQETGLLISEGNEDQFSQIDLDLWQSKIDEFRFKQQGGDGEQKFPLGTVALYGPDDEHTTKIVAGIFLHPNAEPILERFVGSNVSHDERVQRLIEKFFQRYKVASVVHTSGNIGCPHEEGEDFPIGEDCPFCPFWKGMQGSSV